MRRLLYFFEDFSEEFEWLEDHKIEKFLVWALCQFVKVTLVYLSHVFEGQRGEGFGSSIRVIRKGLGGETVGAEIGLGGSPLSAEGGLGGSPMNPKKGLAKSQFGPKGCPCHPEKEVGKGQRGKGKKAPEDPKKDLEVLERFAEMVGGDSENDMFSGVKCGVLDNWMEKSFE